MDAPGDSRVVCIDASVFEKQVGDLVWRGEVLGAVSVRTGGQGVAQEVRAPFDGIIQRISFDGERGELLIALQRSASLDLALRPASVV